MVADEYKELLEKYYSLIYKYCRIKTKNEQSAYDCVQEVFLILYEKMDRVEMTENTAIWLYRTADKVISRYFRKHGKAISLESLEAEFEDKSVAISGNYEILDRLITKDELSLLESYYLNGETIKEISVRLSISESAVYKRIERLKAKIIRHKGELV